MKLKGNTRRRRGKPASFLSALTGRWTKRHRLPAHLTGENDWEVEVPQIQMSRAFAVMLVLFIVGVGGLFAFQMFGKEEKKQAQAAAVQGSSAPASLSVQESAPATSAQPAVVLTAPDSPADVALPEPAPELPATVATTTIPTTSPEAVEQQTYRWKTGDTMGTVAAAFGIRTSALRTANPDKPQIPGTEFIIPPPSAGRMITSTETATPAKTGAAIFDPLADRRIAEISPPKAEVVPELPESPAADTPPPAKVVEHTTSKNVATRTTPSEEKKPAVTTAKVKPETKPATTPKATGQRTHVVAKGDTVFNIARRFGISAEEIAKANGLDSNYRIRPGQPLKLPVRR